IRCNVCINRIELNQSTCFLPSKANGISADCIDLTEPKLRLRPGITVAIRNNDGGIGGRGAVFDRCSLESRADRVSSSQINDAAWTIDGVINGGPHQKPADAGIEGVQS